MEVIPFVGERLFIDEYWPMFFGLGREFERPICKSSAQNNRAAALLLCITHQHQENIFIYPGYFKNSCDDRAVYWFYKEISEEVAYQ